MASKVRLGGGLAPTPHPARAEINPANMAPITGHADPHSHAAFAVQRAPDQPRLDLGRNVHCLFGLTFDAVTLDEAAERLRRDSYECRPCFVSTPNVNFIIEALSDAGVKNGLPRESASRLAVQTVLGAASMLAETGEHPALLREKVTSPGGTTIAALHVLENGRFRGTIMDAVDAATQRSKELAGK